MRDLAPLTVHLPAMDALAVAVVRGLQAIDAAPPQVPLITQHVIHAGMYARTVRLPPRVRITGALIKIATLVIVQGDALVWIGNESMRLTGYSVLPASTGRKQAFESLTETFITMIFPTKARDVASAEREFTDEFALLASRRCDTPNLTTITGE